MRCRTSDRSKSIFYPVSYNPDKEKLDGPFKGSLSVSGESIYFLFTKRVGFLHLQEQGSLPCGLPFNKYQFKVLHETDEIEFYYAQYKKTDDIFEKRYYEWKDENFYFSNIKEEFELVEEEIEVIKKLLLDVGKPQPITNAGSFTAGELDQIIEFYNLKSPDGNPVSKAKSFNLLVKTHLGPVEDETTVAYLKGESCQNIYVDWKLVQETTRRKLPFGIAQLGKAFRNEVTVKQFMFRTREFEQIDLQYFVKPGEEDKWYDYWKQNHYEFYTQKLQFKPENLQWYQHSKQELAFYCKEAWDIYYKYGALGYKEMQGFHNRTDYDTKVHQEHSGQDLTYLDPFTNERFLPYIVEMSAGLNRMFLALLFEFYTDEEIGENDKKETRVVTKFPYDLAPYKLAILPLMKKDGLAEIANELYTKLRSKGLSTDYDESGSIGKRYRRQDENGTPFCVTIDYDTRDKGLVTIRNRDTMSQETIKIDEIEGYLNSNKN